MKEFEKLCNEYRENKRLIEELEAMNDSLKCDIIAIMGDRETVIDGSTKAIYKTVTSSRIDSKSLKADHPDIAQAYTTETSYKRFTVA
jgi:predicted phage-related endonuclease